MVALGDRGTQEHGGGGMKTPEEIQDMVDNPSPSVLAAIERNRKRQIELKAKYDRYVAKLKAEFYAGKWTYLEVPTYGRWVREIHRGNK